MTPHYVDEGGELNWLLDDLVDRVPQVTKAVMLTRDGLAIATSAALSREDAEHLAALSAGFQSMAGRAPMGHPSMPLPQLTPQPRDVPSAGSRYSPYPMTAGQSDPAPYAEYSPDAVP